MPDMPILKVDNLGKCYRDFGSEVRRVLSWFKQGVTPVAENWTVKNISFEVKVGEALGIVGHNGAGKSTLLKMITGTLSPSEGSVKCNGRVSAILELGMGFHPDFTGRENAYHSAGIMGFSKEQVSSVISDIESFAEVGEYFDQPVRTYSSGMQVRVAFAVATAFQPDILIVDEALSVGDAYFQHKSFSRIRDFQTRGTALILVTHDNSAIMSLCDRAVLLEKGRLITMGDPESVVNVYSARTAEQEKEAGFGQLAEDLSGRRPIRSGTGKATIKKWSLCEKATGNEKELFLTGQDVVLVVECQVSESLSTLGLGFMIRDRYGLPVFGTNSFLNESEIRGAVGGKNYTFEVVIPMNLGKGSYSLTIALEDRAGHRLDWIDMATVFEISPPGSERFIGTAALPVQMSVK